MSVYFESCNTLEELQREYRLICKMLHPDKGGDKAAFQEMQDEYQKVKNDIEYRTDHNDLYDFFSENEDYEYFRRPVKYSGKVAGCYYKFTQDKGADILIDKDHINLIFSKKRAL
jgi:curved DNA-binding protein CbpA